MDLSKYKYFYANGSSFTEGCGLETADKKERCVHPFYKELYGVEWKDKADVNYGARLSQIIGIPCYNDARCGAGLDRVVRTTYDFIQKNWKDRHEFFIILEKVDPFRADVYYKPMDEYFIVTSTYNHEKDITHFQYATRRYYEPSVKEEDEKLQSQFRTWFDNHFDIEEKFLQDEKAFIGLYSFCKLNGIKTFVMGPNDVYFPDCFEQSDIIRFSDTNEYDDPYNWCLRNKLTITHELELTQKEKKYWDYHPGYFGHIEYAKQLANFLGWKGKVNLPIKQKIINGLI